MGPRALRKLGASQADFHPSRIMFSPLTLRNSLAQGEGRAGGELPPRGHITFTLDRGWTPWARWLDALGQVPTCSLGFCPP